MMPMVHPSSTAKARKAVATDPTEMVASAARRSERDAPSCSGAS